MLLGTVSRLWRYPVKSVLGESRDAIDLDSRGVVGDRSFALREANGKIGSGKTTRRFQRIDGLLRYRATLVDEEVEICLPDGRVLRASEPDIDAALSQAIGRPVQLVPEAGVSPFDAAPVHLLTTGSLRSLAAALPDVHLDERRFRPNLVVETDEADQVERSWIGKSIEIGGRVELRIRNLTERCVMVNLPQGELPRDGEVLRFVSSGADSCFGAYAEVIASGEIRCGDAVRVVDTQRRGEPATKTL